MKTAAAIVLALALFGMFSKGKKERKPDVLPPPQRIVLHYDCARPEEVIVDEGRVQRIMTFSTKFSRRRAVDDETMYKIAQNIVRYAAANCIETELAAALVARESGFNPRAVSNAGAQGLGQMIPSTARKMGVQDPFDIEDNLRGTMAYLKELLDMWSDYPDQVDRALGSYLLGPGNVRRAGGVPGSARRYIDDIYAYRNQMLSY
ncbi:MAG: lytic transglycosylase domain-containing protein [bacterium]